jgi:hypothetical protein
MKIHRTFFISVTIVFLCFSACSLPMVGPGRQATLESSVNALWNAMMHKDWAFVYRMADMKFKEQVSLEKFIQGSHQIISEFEVKDVRVTKPGVEGFSFVVFKTIKMGYPFEISVNEKWLFEDGTWRLKISGRKTPFSTRK